MRSSTLTPSIEKIYQFDTKNLFGANGLLLEKTALQPDKGKANSDLRMKAIVRVQSFPDHTMRIKMENIKFYEKEEETSLMNAHIVIRDQIKMNRQIMHDDQTFLKFLEQPVMVLLKGKAFKHLVVSRDEPDFVTILKKSLVEDLKPYGSSISLKLLKTKGIETPIMIPHQVKKVDL